MRCEINENDDDNIMHKIYIRTLVWHGIDAVVDGIVGDSGTQRAAYSIAC